jgi:RHS repeat-associated protein
MNFFAFRSSFLVPAVVTLTFTLAAPTVRSQCCSGRGDATLSGGASHGSLQELFGGSARRIISLKNNSNSQSVDYTFGGKTTRLGAGDSKRLNFGGADPASASIPPLPGETSSPSLSNSTGNSGTNPNVTQEEESACPKAPVSSGANPGTSGFEPSDKVAPPISIPPVAGTNPGPSSRTDAPPGETSPPSPGQLDNNDNGHGGGVLSPGGVSLDGSGNIQLSKPGALVAASLGPSADGGPGRLGFIIPTAPSSLGNVYVFNNRESYAVRGTNPTTYTSGTGTGSITRYVTANGLAELTQTSTNILTFKYYTSANYGAGPTYAPTGSAFRTMTVENLTTGNPNSSKYSLGAKVTMSRPGKADEWKTMWWNNSTTVLNAYTSMSTGTTVETSSTVPTAMTPVRNVDTTVTETFTDASGSSVSLSHRTRDSVRSLKDGEEQVESHMIYLTPNSTPTLTTTYDYWSDSADPINRRTVQRRIEADGSWEVYASSDLGSGWIERVVVRGWKDQAAPGLAYVSTYTAIKNLLQTAGYAGTDTILDPARRMAKELVYVNSYVVAKRADNTTALSTVPAYPFCSVIVESISGAEEVDTVTTQVGWDPANPTSTSAASTMADLRHQTLDIYRMKRRTLATSPYAANPASGITMANVVSQTHYRYLTADPSTTSGYIAGSAYDNSKAYDVVDRVEDVTHLPSLMQRTVTDRASGHLVASESWMVSTVYTSGSAKNDPSGWEVLDRRYTFYDSLGRKSSQTVNGMTMETWGYPTEDSVQHTDATGAVWVTKYASNGRVIYTMRTNVASASYSGVTTMSSAAQPAIFTEYTYGDLTGLTPYSNYGLYWMSTTTTARSGTTLASSPILDGSSQPWTRYVITECFDGADRPVYSYDLNSTENATARPSDQATSPVISRYLGDTPGSGTLLEQETSYLDGSFKQRSGSAVIPAYGDYAAASFQRTSYRSPYSPATGGHSETQDGLGRTASTGTMVPTGSSFPQAGGAFTSSWTYDDAGELTSRMVPGAVYVGPNYYYEVFSTSQSTTYGSDRIAYQARSTDATWDGGTSNDKNLARTLSRYEKISGIWYQTREVQNGSSYTTSGWSRTALGPFSSSITWAGITWYLTGLTQASKGGALVQTAQYAAAASQKTLVQTSVDSVVQQSVLSVAGWPVFFVTPRYETMLSYSPLGDALARPDSTDVRWTKVNVITATGQTASITTPNSTELQESYLYYSGNDVRAGLVSRKATNLSTTTPYVYYDYNALGQVTKQWGGGDCPVRYTYDSLGRMTQLETWRSGTWTGSTWPGSPPTADVTTWSYSDWFDQPNVKTYTAGASGEASVRRKVRYLYQTDGRAYSREWQRTGAGTATGDTEFTGVSTSYIYDGYGRLERIDYSGAAALVTATPSVVFEYDSAGRVSKRTDGAGETTNTWTAWGALSKESLVTSISGVTSVTAEVERTFDGSNRLDLLKAKWGTGTGMVAPDVDYGFDSNGYLNSVASAGRSVVPALASSSLRWGTLTFKNNTSTLMSATRTLDSAGRTSYIAYSQSPTMFQTFTYTYDRQQVTKVVRDQGNAADELAWLYRYDDKGQVTSADKRFSTSGSATGHFLAGHQTGYSYDEAGNRAGKDEGGSDTTAEGTGVRSTSYTANALNQYSAITNPSSGGVQSFDVTGRRDSSSENIKVNTVLASYQDNTSTGLHFDKVVTHTATSGAGSYEAVTVTKDTGGSPTTIDGGNYYQPPPSETLTYDADGNLRQDGHWDYLWDAENRLTSLTTRHTASSTYPGLRLTFGYDGLSRRIWKKVEKTTNGSTWTIDTFEAFLYDVWHLVMKVKIDGSGTATDRQSYIWGPDLASLPDGHSPWQSAGGVGGLLIVLDKNATAYTSTGDNYFPLMDRMGNVTGYRSSDSGSSAVLSAVYEYDAFGREMKSVGPSSDKLPFRFSTKFTDNESGLAYYGYRYYDPTAGRWINRDPIAEEGGCNVYAMVLNAPVDMIDLLGLDPDSGKPSVFDPMVQDPASGIYRIIGELNQIRDSKGRPCYVVTIKKSSATVAEFFKALKECDLTLVSGHGEKRAGGSTDFQLEDKSVDTQYARQTAQGLHHGVFITGCHIYPMNDQTDSDPDPKTRGVQNIEEPKPGQSKNRDKFVQKKSAEQAIREKLEQYKNKKSNECCEKPFKICVLFGNRYSKPRNNTSDIVDKNNPPKP